MTQEQVNQIVQAIQDLSYEIEQLRHNLRGDGGHTVGDSLEGIMVKLLQDEKK